jgi:sodium-coupled monocarboxylate transporter 8/12
MNFWSNMCVVFVPLFELLLRNIYSALWVNLLGLLFLVSLCSFGGLVIFAKYKTCDPLKAKIVSTSDQLFPLFVMDVMGNYPGIPGVFVAGIFSGALRYLSFCV